MQVTTLDAEGDGPVVRAWLAEHVRDHLRAWTAEVEGAPWGDERIDAHVVDHRLVEREWRDVLWAAGHEGRGHVRIVRAGDGAAIGCLWAEERPDRFLCRPVAALCWIFVDPAWRGRGVADLLMAGYEAWTCSRPVVAREVYVTAGNEPAGRLYARRGFSVSDRRLLAPARALERSEA